MRPYNEIQLGRSDRLDVLIGATAGAALAAVVIYDVLQRILGWIN